MSKPKAKIKSELGLKPIEPKSIQKTVRIPREIVAWLEYEVARVGRDKLTIPAAIVQILEKARAAQLEKSA